MFTETPRFIVAAEAEQVLLRSEPHRERPEVLFAMLSATSLRSYNTVVPKQENMYLAELQGAEDTRALVTELDVSEANLAIHSVITNFEALYGKLRSVSDGQIMALTEHASRILRH